MRGRSNQRDCSAIDTYVILQITLEIYSNRFSAIITHYRYSSPRVVGSVQKTSWNIVVFILTPRVWIGLQRRRILSKNTVRSLITCGTYTLTLGEVPLIMNDKIMADGPSKLDLPEFRGLNRLIRMTIDMK